MAGLWQRTTLIVKSKYSKVLNRAENPTETLDYSYEQMLEQLQNVKRGTADVVTSKKRLELQQQKLEQNVVKLETQARQAVAANREDLARQALERKTVAQQQLQDMDGQVKQLEDQQEKLVAAQQQLETRIESFRSQKEVLKAQYSAAEAQVKVGEAATGIGEHMQDTGLAIQRAKDKTEEMQARASAIDELTSTGALEDFTAGDQTQLDRELAQISSTSQVDDELAKLKAEVGSGAPQKEIAAGDAEPHRRRDPQPAAKQSRQRRRTAPAATPSRRPSRPRKPPSRPDPLRRHPLRPQEAGGACGREAVRALDRGRHARHGVLAQDGRRRRADLQAALGGRVHLGRERRRGAAPRRRQGLRLQDRPQDRLVRLRVGDRPRPAARRPGRGRPHARLGARGPRLRRPAPRRRLPLRRLRVRLGPSRLLDLRLQDRHVVAVRPDRREAAARQRRRAGAEGEARAGAPDRARPQQVARPVRRADLVRREDARPAEPRVCRCDE